MLKRKQYYWIVYGIICLLFLCRSACHCRTFFVECYNCTAHGWSECYSWSRRCPRGARAFYCYTFYQAEGTELGRGCATDIDLIYWLKEPPDGPRQCKDTKDGTKACYCLTDIPPCPLDPSSSTTTTQIAHITKTQVSSKTSLLIRSTLPSTSTAIVPREIPDCRTPRVYDGYPSHANTNTDQGKYGRSKSKEYPIDQSGKNIIFQYQTPVTKSSSPDQDDFRRKSFADRRNVNNWLVLICLTQMLILAII